MQVGRSGEKPWLVALANLHDVNTPNMAGFMLPVTSPRAESGRSATSPCRCASQTYLQQTWGSEPRPKTQPRLTPTLSNKVLLEHSRSLTYKNH